MNKKIFRLLTLPSIAVLTLSATACSASDIPDSSVLDTVVSASEGGKTSDKASDALSLESLWKALSEQSQTTQLSTDRADVEVYVEQGNIYVFRFTRNELIDPAPDPSVYDRFMTEQADVYQNARDAVASELGMDDLIFRIIYVNADGTELYSVDFY